MLLEGLEGDGQGKAEPAGGRAEFAALVVLELTGGVRQDGFELLEVLGVAEEIIEIGETPIVASQELEEVASPGGGTHEGGGNVGTVVGNDVVDEEGQMRECDGLDRFWDWDLEFHMVLLLVRWMLFQMSFFAGHTGAHISGNGSVRIETAGGKG